MGGRCSVVSKIDAGSDKANAPITEKEVCSPSMMAGEFIHSYEVMVRGDIRIAQHANHGINTVGYDSSPSRKPALVLSGPSLADRECVAKPIGHVAKPDAAVVIE